jgi:2-amino-4-hydroxy-6-hydroxymethyldihydropteridine diphosphokinase
MAQALISLGSNVGNPAESLRQALALLALVPGLRVTVTSSFHETKPAGGPAAQENFLNAAARLETDLPPPELFSVLQNLEQKLGRIRTERWGPRTIDLDLLLYDGLELETPELILPHPRMSFRRFVLEPAAETAPEMVHPLCGNTIAGLLRHLEQTPRYLAVAGFDPAVTAVLQRNPRLVVAVEQERRISAGDPAKLLGLIDELEHDQWLVGEVWGASHSRFTISDRGGIESPAETMSALVQPKLLIVLPAAGPSAAVRQRIRETYRGPVLWLKHAHAPLVSDEVLAAIQAME